MTPVPVPSREENPAAQTRIPLRIAMIGTRGVPAAYGGFETAIEEVGRRLVARGHRLVVYTRGAEVKAPFYLGMRTVHLPALPIKQLETLTHTALSTAHAVVKARPDVAFVFNAANAPFLPLLRARGIPVALHMDGLEWKRSKWGPRGRAYYRWAEQFGVRAADALIADAPGIAEYYQHQFGMPTSLIRYGAPVLRDADATGIREYGFEPWGYHLVVARFEPENHVLEIVEGYTGGDAKLPLVVIGSAPYSADYTKRITRLAAADPRIHLLGGVYDQDLLDAFYAHALTYVHGHSVGGTNPSLLRAMGAGTAVIAYDVHFNREVLAGHGWFFKKSADLPAAFHSAEADSANIASVGRALRERAVAAFRWDDVAADYERLALSLRQGASTHQYGRKARRTDAEFKGTPHHVSDS
ncbi:DUF1972 domain-containing protein [Microbacterium sp. KR10-403]|uniref:DUF1972 domain-containing protein n=1 Tax=Microbacterium sp. KR10-403 TaxID=3158581 RepID=UPI0032E4F132